MEEPGAERTIPTQPDPDWVSLDESAELINSANANFGRKSTSARSTIPVPEIAKRLGVGRVSVYAMLEQGIIPGVRLGRRWIVTQPAYEEWERTCGLSRLPEGTVVSGRP
jgi:excisionase family DNA binding protein